MRAVTVQAQCTVQGWEFKYPEKYLILRRMTEDKFNKGGFIMSNALETYQSWVNKI